MICDACPLDSWRRHPGDSRRLDHRSITSTAVYTALAPNRFKDFWRDYLMADNKSCDEVHPAGTHMGRLPSSRSPSPRPAYKPTFQEASRHSPAFSRKKACRA
jgi:hypothetical protein